MLKEVNNDCKDFEELMDSIINYNILTGIGEFSHGNNEIWDFRFEILKKIINTTNHKVIVFNEMSGWQAENLMNDTYWDISKDKAVKYKKNNKGIYPEFKTEKPVFVNARQSAWGKYWQYVMHSSESRIVLDILHFIYQNKDRITLIGVDNDELARDYDMFHKIKNNLDRTCVNLFWAHNAHIDNRELSEDNYEWIKDKYPDQRYYCGYYLKSWLRDRYCIILSTGIKGEVRFNSSCQGYACKERIWYSEYNYADFNVDIGFNVKKIENLINDDVCIVEKRKKYKIKIIEFSNSEYLDNLKRYQTIIDTDSWDYLIIFPLVTPLSSYGI